jgi:hypothetical protein
MVTARALVKEADIRRAIRVARKEGVHRVRIGGIEFDLDAAANEAAAAAPDDSATTPYRIRKNPKKKVVL